MIKLIPSPKTYEISDEVLRFPLKLFTEEADFLPGAEVFADAFRKLYGAELAREPGGLLLRKDASLAPGAYALEAGEALSLRAADSEGILYALASLLQLADGEYGCIRIPRVRIEDRPDKGYRSLMVDLAREWHPFPKLLKFVDICFWFKIKYLHLHFIDSRRYTLPSKAFPKLPNEGEHYTFDQIRELNDYARARGVIPVPEYEGPGHALRYVEVYPEVFGDHAGGEPIVTTRTEHGEPLRYRELMCASNPLCMEANERLLKEIADMFPDSPYIHIGGDEAQIKQWEQCDDCTRYMREQGIADVYELYSRFVGRTAAYVLSLGRTPIVWEGFPKKGHEHVPKETVVVAWESYYHMVYDLLEEGFRVINASWEPLYIVPSFARRWSPFDILKWNVYRWQHWWPKSEAFLDPITVAPTDRVLGATLCSWEQSFELEINALMENLAALSERTWNVRRSVTDEEYTEMYQAQRLRLSRLIQDR